jgi:predicted DNA-binding protein
MARKAIPDRKTIAVYVPGVMAERLQTLADQNHRNLSEQVRDLIHQATRDLDTPQPQH